MLPIRIDERTRVDLADLAGTHNLTVSDLIREQLDVLLGRDVTKMRSEAPRSLSMGERLTLSLQQQILAKQLDGYEADHHRQCVEILHEGYAGESDKVFNAIDAEMPRTECDLVWSILDMFRILSHSIHELSPTDVKQLDERFLKFRGLDLNDSREGRMLGYIHYVIKTDRWTEIQECLEQVGDRGNSHHQNLAVYQRMLAVYKPIIERRSEETFGLDAYSLPLEDRQAIADAAPFRQ